MIKSASLIVLLLGVTACQRSNDMSANTGVLASLSPKEAGTNASTPADQGCGDLSPHAAQSDCRLRIAAETHAALLKALDANRQRARAYDALPDNKGYQAFLMNLEASQVAWEKYTKAQCAFESEKNAGSGGWDLLADCQERLYRARLTELNKALAWDSERGEIETGKK